jgi:cation-transporting ATPase 13A2
MKDSDSPILVIRDGEASENPLKKDSSGNSNRDVSTARDSNGKPDGDSSKAQSNKILESDSPVKHSSFSMDDSLEQIKESKPAVQSNSTKPKKAMPKLRKEHCREAKKDSLQVKGSSEIDSVELLKKSLFLQVFYSVASVLTFGLLPLANKWSNNRLYCKLCFRVVDELTDSDSLAVTDTFGSFSIVLLRVKQVWAGMGRELHTFVFEHNYSLFYYDEDKHEFCNLFEAAENHIYDNFHSSFKTARVEEEVVVLKNTFGPNRLQPNLRSFRSIVIDSLLTPLVFFEAICLGLLHSNGQSVYFLFLSCLFVVMLVMNIQEKFRAENRLLESVDFAEQIMVIRKTKDGLFKKRIIDSGELVVGDMVEVTNSLKVPADMVLVQGVCVVKDDFATDDDNTSTRIALDCMGVSGPRNRKCSLLAGNQVLYTLNKFNESCLAVVVRIGFSCKRAEKLKQMIVGMSRRSQSSWQLALLVAAVAVCCLYPLAQVLVMKVFHKKAAVHVPSLIDSLCQLLTICLKPLLPILALLVIKLSTRRLSHRDISINDHRQFQSAGRIRQIVFESKLLLSEEKVTAGYLLVSNDCDGQRPVFDKILTNPKRLFKQAETSLVARRFCEVAGMCNLVFKVGSDLFGSETEKEMIANSGFNLVSTSRSDWESSRSFIPKNECIKTFARDYNVFRYVTDGQTDRNRLQSVLVRDSEGRLFVLTKGDPNAVECMMDNKTLPANFNARVAKYANKGFKCLAFGFRQIEEGDVRLPDDQLQSNLTFAGLYLFKFCAPDNAEDVTKVLQSSNLNVILMTSGSVFSGIATARNNEVISSDKKVVLLQTEVVEGSERFLVTMMEPKVGGVSVNESAISSDKLNVVRMEDSSEKDILKSNDCLAVTGKAFSLLVQSESSEFIGAVLDRCRVYGNLSDSERTRVMRMLRRGTASSRWGYVYDDIGCETQSKKQAYQST